MSQQINLFNPIFLRQKKYFSARTMAQSLGLILAGGLIIAGYSWYQSRTLSQQATQMGTQLTDVQQQLARINAQYAPRPKNAALEEEVNRMQAEQTSLQQAMSRLQNEEFGNRKGYSSYMRAFSRQIVDGLWLTGFSIEGAGSSISIQGSALRPELVPAYMRRLGQESVFQGKSFSMLEMQTPPKEAQKLDASGKPIQNAKALPADRIDFLLRSQLAEKEPVNAVPADLKKSPDTAISKTAPLAVPASPATDPSGAKKE